MTRKKGSNRLAVRVAFLYFPFTTREKRAVKEPGKNEERTGYDMKRKNTREGERRLRDRKKERIGKRQNPAIGEKDA